MKYAPWLAASSSVAAALAICGSPATAAPPCTSPCIVASNYNVVNHTVATVNGLSVDHYMWFDSQKLPRTLSLKREGAGNSGHGGYAVQMTYVLPSTTPTPHYYTVTVNAENSGDGGFGYFVSHERYRSFSDGSTDTIAGKIFHADDSPLGSEFAVTARYLTATDGPFQAKAIQFTTPYYHYGTLQPDPVDPNTGLDSTPLPTTPSSFKKYIIPVTTTWVIEALHDDPRIDIGVGLAGIGGVDLVNFDVRGPYGVMVFDNGADGTVGFATWGDQAYFFAPSARPIIRDRTWNWSSPNTGGRFNALVAGGYEMGLYEPRNVNKSATVDGYASERGYSAGSFKSAGGASYDSCLIQTAQTLPSDGTWPYQSVQYSLPCPTANTSAAIHTALTTPATGKKIAWGSTAYLGSSLQYVYNGQNSFPFNGYPTSGVIDYSVCLALGLSTSPGLTRTKASAYIPGNPNKIAPHCAMAATS